MPLFEYKDEEALGNVLSVDTTSVVVKVSNIERLRKMQVNRLVTLQSSRPGQFLVGIVQKITRSSKEEKNSGEIEPDDNLEDFNLDDEINLVRIALIGTFLDKDGNKKNIFRRTLETVPEIDGKCFSIEGDYLTDFMRVISNVGEKIKQKLSLGHYTLDEHAEAYLNGNRFFQRHAIIVGSTGSGKSWTTARILEQVASLDNANAIVFDIHGEYKTLSGEDFCHFHVAGSGDLRKKTGIKEGILYIPYWLLSYEALISMFVDRTDQNAPNQSMVISRTVTESKKKFLEKEELTDILDNFTIDSPIPFCINEVIEELKRLNSEMVEGKNKEKQGDYYGKLSRLISRLENKLSDRRLGFLFQGGEETQKYEWLTEISQVLIDGKSSKVNKNGGVKIIDFSEVPSDILPLIVSLIARLVFSVQQWCIASGRHPIAIFCDEAHLYIPDRIEGNNIQQVSIDTFERIAKEGRKYGVGLVVISQRPSEVNKTVLSQCNNLVAMRLANAQDQTVVRRLLPDSLGGFSDLLPILDTGEALVVGDASLLPSRIRITAPKNEPSGCTINFWDKWATSNPTSSIVEAVNSWRKQNSETAI